MLEEVVRDCGDAAVSGGEQSVNHQVDGPILQYSVDASRNRESCSGSPQDNTKTLKTFESNLEMTRQETIVHLRGVNVAHTRGSLPKNHPEPYGWA